MKNILVPCDFSKPAEEAFKFAVQIAAESKGSIHVLYVIDITFLHGNSTLSHSYAFNLNFLKDIELEVNQKFHVMWNKYAPMTMPVKFRHVISSLTTEVENYIQAENIDLVIMGTHGEGNATFGSNAEQIIRNSSIPVLAIRKAPEKINSIVLPVIPDQADGHFIKQVKALQSFFNAKLHLLYINTPMFFKSDPDSEAEVKRFGAQNFENYTVNIRFDYTLEEGIKHFMRETNADMIAMGTHAWKGLWHLLIGSTTEDVVNHLNIPIWTTALE